MQMENFSLEDEVIDLEWAALNGHKVPKGRKYRIRIDREKYLVNQECMTGKELLILAGKNPPDRFQLRQKLRGGNVITIPLDKRVCFTEPGIEKFKTLPLDQTEGESLRRDFTPLEEDVEYLDSLGLQWEAIKTQNAQWILIHDYPIVTGYNVDRAIIAVRISPSYPTTQLDMAYFHPPLNRADGKKINALTLINLDGKQFQQWSRHRTAANPWRDGVDNLSTHLPLADVWLGQEFERHPRHAVPA
jgi:hypothetical protein